MCHTSAWRKATERSHRWVRVAARKAWGVGRDKSSSARYDRDRHSIVARTAQVEPVSHWCARAHFTSYLQEVGCLEADVLLLGRCVQTRQTHGASADQGHWTVLSSPWVAFSTLKGEQEAKDRQCSDSVERGSHRSCLPSSDSCAASFGSNPLSVFQFSHRLLQQIAPAHPSLNRPFA